MKLDTKLEFSSDQELPGTVGSNDSTNVLDLQNADPNIGAGTPIWLICRVTAGFSPSTAVNLYVEVKDASDGSTYAVIHRSPLFQGSTGALDKGDPLLYSPLPAFLRRWLKLTYITAGTSLTAGKVDAFLTLAAPRAK